MIILRLYLARSLALVHSVHVSLLHLRDDIDVLLNLFCYETRPPFEVSSFDGFEPRASDWK